MSRLITKQKQSTNISSAKNEEINQKLENITNRSFFETVVVTDFVSNPEEYLDQNVIIPEESSRKNIPGSLKNKYNNKTDSGNKGQKTYRDFLKTGPNRVVDYNLVDLMPRNSVIGINITSGKNVQNLDQLEIFFPFFSHISLPVKAGEQVWVFYEMMQGRKVGYWLSRKVGTLFVEDLNYTHIDRQAVISAALTKNLGSRNVGKKERVNLLGMTFPNPAVSEGDTGTLVTQNYDDVLLRSLSHNLERGEFIGEAVPRYSKKCADLVLQGSNNTLISMTHESVASSGTIMLIAGRQNIPARLKNVRSVASSLIHDEIDKLSLLRGEDPNLNEGSIDGTESASITLTENHGGLIDLRNGSGSSIRIIPNDSESLDTDGGIVLRAPNEKYIRLGGIDAEESAVLGDTLADILSELINNLLTISLATGVGPTGPLSASVDGGGAQISQLLSRIESIKSATTKVK